MKPDSTTFSLSADSLDEAVQGAVDHLREVCESDGFRGFTAPTMVQESFQRIDGVWARVFRFRAELLPERA